MDLLPKPPARILDVGCGPGLGAKIMKERGYEIVGIDYNERAVQFAEVLVPDARFILGDVRSLEQVTHLHNWFDSVTAVEVIEHIPPEFHANMLKGIRHVLRSTGVLVLTAPSRQMPLNPWHYKHFDLDELVHMVEGNGFQVTEVVYQHRMSVLFSNFVQRLISNRYYDIRFARHALRRLFLRWYNTTDNPDKAGRFIIQARRV